MVPLGFSWRAVVAVLSVVAGLSLTVFMLVSSPTDEERIAGQLERLAAAVSLRQDENLLFRRARLTEEFREIFTKQARVVVPELGNIAPGPEEIAAVGAAAASRFLAGSVDFRDIEVEIGERRTTAVSRAVARFSGNRAGEGFDSETRAVKLEWVKRDGDWLVDSARVEMGEEPELD